MKPRILVLGASGYVGSRLVSALLEQGFAVRAVGRSLARLRQRPWADRAELVVADALKPETLGLALKGCDVAYYLLHSMELGTRDFAATELAAATNFAKAARLERVIYLGGLASDTPQLSAHLRSRNAVAAALRGGLSPVTHLRSPMIIGRGSASFELLRDVADHIRVILLPSWTRTRTQPIAIGNALTYLVACATLPAALGETFDVGGPAVTTYEKLLELYEGLRALKRWHVPTPALPVSVSSFMMRFATRAPRELVLPLLAGLGHNTVVRDKRLRDLVPQELLSPRDAIITALRVDEPHAAAFWSGDASWVRK